MRVFLGIAVGVMLAMHNGISPRVQKRRALANKREHVKRTFEKLMGSKHFVRSIPVQKKRLEKERQEPMRQKEDENVHQV